MSGMIHLRIWTLVGIVIRKMTMKASLLLVLLLFRISTELRLTSGVLGKKIMVREAEVDI